MEIHCFAPLSNVSMSVLYSYCNCDHDHLQVFLTERKGRRQCGCEERRKGSFKGSKTGVGFLHVGLLSRHGGTDAVLFYETMNYILWTQVPASLLQVGTSWRAG